MFFQINFSIKEKDVILQNLQTTESQLKSQLSELETGLETQRAKNNVSIKLLHHMFWKGEIDIFDCNHVISLLIIFGVIFYY